MSQSDKACVLVVDPVQTDRARLRDCLADSQVELIEVTSMAEALWHLEPNLPDLVITELDLPDASGFALCRHMREQPAAKYVPVIMLATWTSEFDRILAFECGADDFVPKPFFARELSSRVEAVLRRRRSCEPSDSSERSQMPAEPSGTRPPREVLFDGHALRLTPKERALLGALARAGGRVLSREDLIEQVWGAVAAPTSRSVDSHIKSLRRKLARASACIETVRGVGYRFAPHPELELR